MSNEYRLFLAWLESEPAYKLDGLLDDDVQGAMWKAWQARARMAKGDK